MYIHLYNDLERQVFLNLSILQMRKLRLKEVNQPKITLRVSVRAKIQTQRVCAWSPHSSFFFLPYPQHTKVPRPGIASILLATKPHHLSTQICQKPGVRSEQKQPIKFIGLTLALSNRYCSKPLHRRTRWRFEPMLGPSQGAGQCTAEIQAVCHVQFTASLSCPVTLWMQMPDLGESSLKPLLSGSETCLNAVQPLG